MSRGAEFASSPGRWTDYYHATAHRPPRATLLRALEAFAAEPTAGVRRAIDLGCGIGRDTITLLRAGWQVLAIDAEAAALATLERGAAAEGHRGLETRCARLEEVTLPPADLVNASFSLFACPAERFARLWAGIEASLGPGGRFAGQLLGPNDSWAGRPGLLTHTASDLARLLDRFVVEWQAEEESDAVTPRGGAKHWHLWHVVARRRS